MPRPRRSSSARAVIELLEPRIAPAVLLNARTLVFTDADGDFVTVKFSKDVFSGDGPTRLAKANEVFKFDVGDVTNSTAMAQQLRLIDLTKLPTIFGVGSVANGASLTVTSEERTGNGWVDVGAIKATGISLGKVTIEGDLGQIDAGGTSFKIGCAGLTVNSLGARGTATQIPVPAPTAENPAPDLVSTITGELTALKVFGNIQDARLSVVHGRDAQNNLTTLGNLGSISIGGSLIGSAPLAVASENTGLIEADGNVGAIRIGTTVVDGIYGGGGKTSGRIKVGGTIASVHLSGSVFGGAGLESGMVSSGGSMGSVTIGNDLAGGSGESSGVIRSFGNLGAVRIGGDLVAGAGAASGLVFSRGAMATVLIQGSLDASIVAAGAGAGGIFGNAGMASVTIQGDLRGGAQAQTGFVESGRDLGTVTIRGDVAGGAGDGSGAVVAHGKLSSINIGGSLRGGAGKESGLVRSGFDPMQSGDLGTVVVQGLVQGGGNDDSGAILSAGSIRSVTLGNSTTALLDVLRGGSGAFSGAVSASGAIGSVKILGGVRGGGGDFSGSLLSFDRTDASGEIAGNLGAINIAGELIGGSGAHSASILADGALQSLSVAALEGGSGGGSASIETGRGLFSAGDSGAIKILGRFGQAATGLPGADSATIDIGGNLASLTVGAGAVGATLHVGDAVGSVNFGADVANVVVTARGQVVQGRSTDLAIGKIVAQGDVSGTSFLAGYDASGAAVNPDAQIGAVAVSGNWTASNLVAGVATGSDAGFGNALDIKAPGFDNAAIISRIASVVIGGAVAGTAADGDHFGFVAQMVSKFKAGPNAAELNDDTDEQVVELDGTHQDVSVREIPCA